MEPAKTLGLKPGDISSPPSMDGNMDRNLSYTGDSSAGRLVARIEPATGEAPLVLGGSSDDQTLPMPVAVQQIPSSPPGMEAPVEMEPEIAPMPEPVEEISPSFPTPDAAILAMPDMPSPDMASQNPVGPNDTYPEPYQAGMEDPSNNGNDLPPPDVAIAPAPAAAPVQTSMPEMQNEVVSGNSATTRLTPEPSPDTPDVYYDSGLNVPSGPLAETVGPRKIDPLLEPGSKLIISRQTSGSRDVEAQLVAANRALDLGRYEAALDMFDRLYERNQRDTRILMGRAVAQQRLGMDDIAILGYEALLDLLPNNTNAIVNMMGLLQKQYPSVALRRLTDLRERYPANAGIAAQLGMTYAALGQNQEALRALGAAASLEPQNPQHLYNMAVIADRAGSKALAIQYYEQSLQEDAVYGGGRSLPRDKIYDRLSILRQ